MDNKDFQNLVFLIILGLFIYFLLKRKGIALGSITYNNEEVWEIVRDPQTGALQKIVVHRKAEQNG